MSNPEYTRIFVRSGAAEAVVGDRSRVAGIIEANYRPDGRMRTEVAQSVIPLVPLSWGIAGALSTGQLNQRIWTPQPGTVERLTASVTSAPAGGPLVVVLTAESAVTALFEVARITVPATSKFNSIQIPAQPLPAGTGLGIAITAANGASGLSVTVAFRGDAA